MKPARDWLPTVCLALLMALSAAALAQPAQTTVAVARPPAGETLIVDVPPGTELQLDFDLADARLDDHYPDLLLAFTDGARVVLLNLLLDDRLNSVKVSFAGITIPASALAAQSMPRNGQAAEPPAAANGGDHTDDLEPEPAAGAAGGEGEAGQPNLAGLRHTGRDLLFVGESERAGHPLYSYLLFAGTSDGDREERARFRAAIEAYVGQVASAAALEASGAARGEINIFYAPVTPFFADTTPDNLRLHFAQRSAAEQIALLAAHYDRARAEVLIGRMRLAGNGPYIVSLLRPLTRAAISADEAFLVQDLSGVPPELVALWVDEFKRQVVREATGSPEHLRRLALGLRTQIAVLAEAFSITKSAVADMFEEPGGGDGN